MIDETTPAVARQRRPAAQKRQHHRHHVPIAVGDREHGQRGERAGHKRERRRQQKGSPELRRHQRARAHRQREREIASSVNIVR